MTSPFGTEPVEEVPLERAPLARVIAQVRFPQMGAFTVNDDAANEVVSRLLTDYPLFNEGREMTVTISPDGVTQQPGPARTWQLQDSEKEWQVTFGREFVALHTSAYTSRRDFIRRLADVATHFVEVVQPPFTERVGYRYINRMSGAEIADLPVLVKPEVLGGLAVPTSGFGVTVRHTLSEALYEFGGELDVSQALHARWGQLPPQAVLDPTLPPLDEPSWVLDLDSYRLGKGEFSAAAIRDDSFELAERAYRFFRWAVTDEFLARFGAKA